MKKLASFLLCLLMLLTACAATAESAEKAATVAPGGTLTMEVSISGAGGKSGKIGIKTNDAPVTFVSAAGGSANDTVPPRAFNDYFVIVNLEGTSFTPDGSGFSGSISDYTLADLTDGVIGTLTFKVNADAALGTYTVEAVKQSGSFTVSGSVTFTVVEGGAAGNRVPGDVNEDGMVDMRDTVALNRFLAEWGNKINESNADVNADGLVDMRDTVLLNRYLAEWEGVTLK